MDSIVLAQYEFSSLPEYSASLPTGTVVGKKWKCNRGKLGRPDWYLGEYVDDPDPKLIGIKWRKLYVNENSTTIGSYTIEIHPRHNSRRPTHLTYYINIANIILETSDNSKTPPLILVTGMCSVWQDGMWFEDGFRRKYTNGRLVSIFEDSDTTLFVNELEVIAKIEDCLKKLSATAK